ncbi:PilZ domain-containing protein [Rhodospirillaceae bacterium KN72]|uniref:PilZ domain-containing protein n=1 Tax=Pacificispira spongiicola TaxID=2729598 RepID=A0A7Y0E395_9PROT|nr:PilZ domain-containing protein [Pacificispira spongiicola]NMM46429.1 PilZ domain-containing protein [Pacificispira spongiicola]
MFSRLISIIKPGDRRKERRVKVRLPAEVGGIKGRLTDLSLGGFGFYPDQEGLDVGDEVMASLMPDEFTTLDIPSRVVGTDEEGMVLCIAFMKVDADQFDPLQDIITTQTVGH